MTDSSSEDKIPDARWRRSLVSVIGFLLLLPGLIVVDLVPFSWRFGVLIAVAAALAAFAASQRMSLHSLGFRKDNLRPALMLQLPLIIALVAILGLAPFLGLSGRKWVPDWPFYIFYIFVSSPSQEFIYRSYLFAACNKAEVRGWIRILVLVVPYALVHIIYMDVLTLILTTLIGIVWAVTYSRHPNIFAVSISHAVLGVATIALGII